MQASPKSRLFWVCVCVAFVLGFAQHAGAVIIGFEGIADRGGFFNPATPYSEGGFTLGSTDLGATSIFDANFPSINTNGTDVFGWCGGPDCISEPVILTMTQDNGNLFSIESMQATNLFTDVYSDSMAINVVGNTFGGGQVNQTFDLGKDNFEQFLFSSEFTNLLTIEISPNIFPELDFVMDNLVVSDRGSAPAPGPGPAPVPEPTTILLFGTGLLGLGLAGFSRRAKKANHN